MSVFRELWEKLKGKGPAAAVAISLDLMTVRSNQPWYIEAGGLIVEYCTGDLYARINGPNGDGVNLRLVRRIIYPISSLFLTNTAQGGRSARLLLLSPGMEAETPGFGEPKLLPGRLGYTVNTPGNQTCRVTVTTGEIWDVTGVLAYIITDATVVTRYPLLVLNYAGIYPQFENSQASGFGAGLERYLEYVVDLGQPGEVVPGPSGIYYMNYLPRVSLTGGGTLDLSLLNGVVGDLISLYVFGSRRPL